MTAGYFFNTGSSLLLAVLAVLAVLALLVVVCISVCCSVDDSLWVSLSCFKNLESKAESFKSWIVSSELHAESAVLTSGRNQQEVVWFLKEEQEGLKSLWKPPGVPGCVFECVLLNRLWTDRWATQDQHMGWNQSAVVVSFDRSWCKEEESARYSDSITWNWAFSHLRSSLPASHGDRLKPLPVFLLLVFQRSCITLTVQSSDAPSSLSNSCSR